MTERKEKKKKKRKGFQVLRHALSGFHIEADAMGEGLCVYLSGVRSVLDFDSEHIELKTDTQCILIKGQRLIFSVYENDSVQIQGRVEEIDFVYAKSK